jgi:outer membrane protein TolC
MILILTLLVFSGSVFGNVHFFSTVKSFLKIDPQYQEIRLQEEYQNTLLTQARAELFLPSISLTSSINKDKSISGDNVSDYQNSNLRLRYTLFNFGADYSNLKSSQMNLKSYKNNLINTYIEREKVIIESLLNYISWQKKIEIQKEIYDLKNKLLILSQKKYSKGILSSVDLLKVEIDKVNAESELLLVRQKALSYEDVLREYVGDVELVYKEFPLMKLISKSRVSKLLASKFNVEKSPKLKELKFISEAYDFQAIKEKQLNYGSFSFEYSRSLYQSDNTDDLYGHSTSLIYTLPLFERFSRQSSIQKITAKAMSAKYYYKSEQRFLESSLRSSKEKLKISFKNFETRAKILKSSKQLFASSSSQFKRGKLSVNELLIEQNRLLTTKLLTNSAVYDLHIRYVELVHKYGKLVSEDSY